MWERIPTSGDATSVQQRAEQIRAELQIAQAPIRTGQTATAETPLNRVDFSVWIWINGGSPCCYYATLAAVFRVEGLQPS